MKFLLALLPQPRLWLFAQEGGTSWDLSQALGQIGIGAILVVPTGWWAMRAERRAAMSEERERQTMAAWIARERELGATALPIIERAAIVLEGVQQGMASQVQVARATAPPELDAAVRELHSLLDRLGGRSEG